MSRRCPTPSSARPSSMPSASRPTTRDGRCCCWPTRSATSSQACARRCCPGCSATLRRNVGRGTTDIALFESGSVVHLRDGPAPRGVTDPPRPPVTGRPTPAELAALEALLPDQPTHVGVALSGLRSPSGWWGAGEPAIWADAIEAARVVASAVGCGARRTPGEHAGAVAPRPLRGARRRRCRRRRAGRRACRRARPARLREPRRPRTHLRDGARPLGRRRGAPPGR